MAIASTIRMRVRNALEGATLDPRAMPPAAILLVRRMRDPAPRVLLRSASAFLPSIEWESALRSNLDAAMRRARRPALDPSLLDANEILFLDDAEMLACFLRDLVHGWSGRWWWKTLRPRAPAALEQTLVHACLRIPNAVPAAFRRLAEWKEAVAVLSVLSPSETLCILAAVARHFNVEHILAPLINRTAALQLSSRLARPGPARVLRSSRTTSTAVTELQSEDRVPSAPPTNSASRRKDTAREQPAIASSIEVSRTEQRSYSTPPWQTYVDASVPTDFPEPEHAALFGIAWLLSVAPWVVRASQFVDELARWRAHSQVTRPQNCEKASVTEHLELDSESAAPFQIQARATDHARNREPGPVPFESVQHDAALSPETRFEDSGETTCIETPQPPLTPQRQEPTHLNSADTGLGSSVYTELGGTLFLINALAPVERGFEEGRAWCVLELLARDLLGTGYQMDPIWRMFAELDGREPDAPASTLLSANRMAALTRWLRRTLTGQFENSDLHSLLLRSARIYYTHTHVDAIMRLDQVTIPVRRSGLDRNPGWRPLLGRIVTFHFREEIR